MIIEAKNRLSENSRTLNDGANLMTLVLEGCTFKDGVLQRQETRQRTPPLALGGHVRTRCGCSEPRKKAGQRERDPTVERDGVTN